VRRHALRVREGRDDARCSASRSRSMFSSSRARSTHTPAKTRARFQETIELRGATPRAHTPRRSPGTSERARYRAGPSPRGMPRCSEARPRPDRDRGKGSAKPSREHVVCQLGRQLASAASPTSAGR
jgi:hypothetical protein